MAALWAVPKAVQKAHLLVASKVEYSAAHWADCLVVLKAVLLVVQWAVLLAVSKVVSRAETTVVAWAASWVELRVEKKAA